MCIFFVYWINSCIYSGKRNDISNLAHEKGYCMLVFMIPSNKKSKVCNYFPSCMTGSQSCREGLDRNKLTDCYCKMLSLVYSIFLWLDKQNANPSLT